MALEIMPASRKRVRLRMLIDGPSGSGKTATGLMFATALARHYGGKVGVISSEHSRDEAYVDTPFAPDGFDRIDLTGLHSVANYCAAIHRFRAAGGYAAVLIDSLSHAWAGKGGLLEEADRFGNGKAESFQKWQEAGKVQNNLIDTIVGAPFHIIATARSKTDWAFEEGSDGKRVPMRVGLKPIQRSEIEYEFNIYAGMDVGHTLTIYKSDFSDIDRLRITGPTIDFMTPIIQWMETGSSALGITEGTHVASLDTIAGFISLTRSLYPSFTEAEVRAMFQKKFGMYLEDAPIEFIYGKIDELKAKVQQAAAKNRPTTQQAP